MIHRKAYFLTFFAALGIYFSGLAQDSTFVKFQKHELRYRTSFETLKMPSEPNLGMLGLGADFFIVKSLPNFYLSLNSFSAITGKRPGLITFGTGAGYRQPLFDLPIDLDLGIYLGGGGGAGAPDGGGLITRAHANLTAQVLKRVELFAGVSRLDFPTGSMNGTQFNLGVALQTNFGTANRTHRTPPTNTNTNTNTNTTPSPEVNSSFFDISKFRILLSAQNYIAFLGENPTHLPSGKQPGPGDIGLLGIEINQFLHANAYALLKLHGAVSGGIDGYMSYLVGLGYEWPIIANKLSIDGQLALGPSGGGAVSTGGGLITQAVLGVHTRLFKDYGIKVGVGQTLTPKGGFNGTLLEVGLSKSFDYASPTANNTHTPYLLTKSNQLDEMGVNVVNRTYFTPDADQRYDKGGKNYDEYFNLLGFVFTKKIYRKLDLVGATYWAYQGSYGAYAEGLLGLAYKERLGAKNTIRLQLLTGAAGGGGIDLGSGFVIQGGVDVQHKFTSNWGIKAGVGKMIGLKGSFEPIYADVGVTYDFGAIKI